MYEHRLPACPRSLPSLGVGLWRKRPSREPVIQCGWCQLGSSHTFHSLVFPFLRRALRQLPSPGALEAGAGGHVFRTIPLSGRGRQGTSYQRRFCAQEALSSAGLWRAWEPRAGQLGFQGREQSLAPPYQSNSHSLLFQDLSISCLFMFDTLRWYFDATG